MSKGAILLRSIAVCGLLAIPLLVLGLLWAWILTPESPSAPEGLGVPNALSGQGAFSGASEPSEVTAFSEARGSQKLPVEPSPPISPKEALVWPGFLLADVVWSSQWEDRKAALRYKKKTPKEFYRIGAVLPNDAILVGIDRRSVQLMLEEGILVRLNLAGTHEVLSRFEAGSSRRPKKKAPIRVQQVSPTGFGEVAKRVLAHLLSDNPIVVQRAIDELLASGEPVIEHLIPVVTSSRAVTHFEYSFPSGSNRTSSPETKGDMAIIMLEELTGESFGTVGRRPRRKIAQAWQRWWGY